MFFLLVHYIYVKYSIYNVYIEYINAKNNIFFQKIVSSIDFLLDTFLNFSNNTIINKYDVKNNFKQNRNF